MHKILKSELEAIRQKYLKKIPALEHKLKGLYDFKAIDKITTDIAEYKSVVDEINNLLFFKR